jgi:hypothetical protein
MTLSPLAWSSFGMLCVGMILRGNAWYGSKDAFGCPSVDIARTHVQAFGRGQRTKRFGAEMRGALAFGPAISKGTDPNPTGN